MVVPREGRHRRQLEGDVVNLRGEHGHVLVVDGHGCGHDGGHGLQPWDAEAEVVDLVEVHGQVELHVRYLFERVVVGVRAVEKVDGDQRVRRLGVEGIQFLEDIYIFRSI